MLLEESRVEVKKEEGRTKGRKRVGRRARSPSSRSKGVWLFCVVLQYVDVAGGGSCEGEKCWRCDDGKGRRCEKKNPSLSFGREDLRKLLDHLVS
jgi:hypothetical protein